MFELQLDFLYHFSKFIYFQGDYEGKALFYSKSNPDNILGCVNMAFTVAAAHDELYLKPSWSK